MSKRRRREKGPATPAPILPLPPLGASVPPGAEMPPPAVLDWYQRGKLLVKRLTGPAKNPFDPKIFQHLSLAAFLAWVGLGADGLSSACYGPEEAYKVLLAGDNQGLSILLALAMAFTVFVISRSYSQIIALFPTGGGGYLVASKLLGEGPGLVSGCALVVDYVLTISISVAAAVAALYSPWPHLADPKIHVLTGALLIAGLLLLNLRGIKESVTALAPIFLLFLATHALLIGAAIFSNRHELIPTLQANAAKIREHAAEPWGLLVLLAIFLRAYSLGGSSFTGIEAVSNSVPVLQEPRVETGRKTMWYMALSLSIAVAGLMTAYLLMDIHPVAGKTFNAILAEKVMGSWPGGHALVLVTMFSSAALLIVAAQAGFLDGPRVLGAMALDSWVPRRFQHLSERLVMKDGILLMGLASLGILVYTKGDIGTLAIMYSINVFLTFTLSQLGICRHWWQVRTSEPRWRGRIFWNALGLAMTASILVITVVEKFAEGGWKTLCLTGGFLLLCLATRRHYRSVERLLKRLDQSLQMPEIPLPETVPVPDPAKPTAVLLVTGFNGLGVHAFYSIQQTFPDYFGNFVFVSAGVIDASRFKGQAEVANLGRATEENLGKYVELCHRLGRPASYRFSVGTDVVSEVEALCRNLQQEHGKVVVFAGKLIFQQENALNRLLHNHAVNAIQRRLYFSGLPMVVLPIRAMG